MPALTVSLIQRDIQWEAKPDNLRAYERLLAQVQQPDLIVLPEMFNTGFTMNAAGMAEPMDGEGVQWLKSRAAEHQAVLMVSMIIAENGHYYNRLIWMPPDGQYQTYDKRHLFSMTEEPKHFTPGQEQLRVQLNGWKLCPVVCFDLRFPEWLRNQDAYDLLLVNANWPEKRAHHWRTLLQARAIENQCYVVGVNRVGEDGNKVPFSGDSMVVDPVGEPLTHLRYTEQVSTITLDPEKLTKTRRHMPFLQEQDGFQLIEGGKTGTP